ncbi:hypothetical protein QBC33DRAFT_484079 [Phialemonium atrogriseum]|uniref:Potassium channel tetramerisation-type BTB domain-containing protein n=1 Tax=Phialemonium atrogriseum TaxID=1093897 RepID=A0AAJ0CCJ3_9PEZI|nr:uncharacterized protein QBC33DRAFT_484079 [Phialemonium atrogriseum]KAK1772777.1 hypothetical protein QBC33DRAFT_484079 [Phialemonium atrogriseum]
MAAINSGSDDTPSTYGSSVQLMPKIPHILPHERVFPIQIGSELFKLSGASISSDAPSYFSHYFKCQIARAEENGEDSSTAIRTLYIDRDPVTFTDISLHLQGYHVTPRDGTHFVRLFADAQFYSLPKLISQLYEESIFMSIGHREFQIPRDLFNAPGNSPNYFSLGFAMFFSSPHDLFPGLDREGLLRPPSILPPSVPGRSAETFAELLHLLRGYPVHIRDEEHRESLLRDCRYFNFKGLEQRLIPHAIAFNQARRRDEIALRLEHILKSGVGVSPEPAPNDPLAGWVTYARPYVDDRPAELVLEIGGEATRLHRSSMRAEFFRDARARLPRLFELVIAKASQHQHPHQHHQPSSQPAAAEDNLVPVLLDGETSIVLDGRPWMPAGAADDEEDPMTEGLGGLDVAMAESDAGVAAAAGPFRKRRRTQSRHDGGGAEAWVVRTGQWRLRVRSARNGRAGVECVLVAVKLDAVSSERARNASRGFLDG